jgi:hypothetical protein
VNSAEKAAVIASEAKQSPADGVFPDGDCFVAPKRASQ